MKKYIAILFLLAGCSEDVGGIIPPLPPCPSESPMPDMAVPADLSTPPACGDVGQPCCAQIDPGATCNPGLVCDNGTCTVPPDMTVPPDLTPPDPCAGVMCPSDQVCTDGQCACTDTSCAPGSTCTNGSCVPNPDMSTPPDMTDPCAGVQCPADQVCTNGQCACTSTSCAVGSACVDGTCQPIPDMSTPPDMTDPCANVVCAVGQTCSNGICACSDTSCPAGDICIAGGCVPPSCDYNQNCTFSQGYWGSHWVCNWQSVKLGTVSYTHAQLLAILGQPVGGNELIALAYQLIGAKMNIVKGANAAQIQATIDAADALIGGLVVPPIGNGSFDAAQTVQGTALATTLESFNLGNLGSPHCQ